MPVRPPWARYRADGRAAILVKTKKDLEMDIQATGPVTLRTNLADYPVTMAMKDGRVTSPIVTLDFCGPKTAHDGFKAMLRENAFDAGELAIVTYLQAGPTANPMCCCPRRIVARFQHHCIGYNVEFGDLKPKDIEGRKVGVRTYAQTTGLWVRGILQHEYGVDLDKVTWLTVDESHICRNIRILPIANALPAGQQHRPDDARTANSLPPFWAMTCRKIRACAPWFPIPRLPPSNGISAKALSRSTICLSSTRTFAKKRPDVVREIFRMIVASRAAGARHGCRLPSADGPGGQSQGVGDGDRLVLRTEDHSAPPDRG